MDHYKTGENIHSVYWTDMSGAGAKKEIQEKGPVFCTIAYFCERIIVMQVNMPQQQSSHLLITVLIKWEIHEPNALPENVL